MPDDHLLVFARLPHPGGVKPFVALELGEEAAVRLQELLLEATIRHAQDLEAVKTLLYTPASAVFEPPWGWDAEPQGEGDIGERLTEGFAHAFEEGARAVVALDCECPMVTPQLLATAFATLHGESEVVLGPSLRGGYYLIGLSRPIPELFREMAWGASTLLRSTLDRALSLSVTPALLPRLYNVESVEDWKKASTQGWLPPPPKVRRPGRGSRDSERRGASNSSDGVPNRRN